MTNVYAQIEKDDYLHFGGGVVSGAAGAFIASELSNQDPFWTFSGAFVGSLLAGAAKEAIDENGNGQWDNRDLGATLLGGLTIGITIELFSAKKRNNRKQVRISFDQEQAQSSFLMPDLTYKESQGKSNLIPLGLTLGSQE